MKKKSWSWSAAGLEVGRPALVDLVGGGGDHRARRLAEDLAQPDDRRDPGGDQVLERLAGADRRQLVGVADEDDVGRLGEAAEQHLGQAQVQHRGLVDDHQVGRQRVAGPEGRLAARHPLEHAGGSSAPRARSPPRAAARRGRSGRRGRSSRSAASRLGDDRPRADGLADAGAAGEDRDPRGEGAAHRRPLLVGEAARAGVVAGVVVEVGGRGGAARAASPRPRARWRGSARGRRGPRRPAARAPRPARRGRGRGRSASRCARRSSASGR